MIYGCDPREEIGYPSREVICRWYRFWPSGQFHVWYRWVQNAADAQPNATEGDNLTDKYFGAGIYYVQGDHLIMESLSPGEDLFCRFQYRREEGYLRADGAFVLIEFKGFDFGFHPKREMRTFSPQMVGNLYAQPDW